MKFHQVKGSLSEKIDGELKHRHDLSKAVGNTLQDATDYVDSLNEAVEA